MTLHPSIAAVRLPVRRTLAGVAARGADRGTVAVACSGGADSLALASASVFEGHKLGMRVVGVTVDHGLQPGSAEQADRVVAQLAAMGVDETLTARVAVDTASGQGLEAAAREARYAVLDQVAEHLGALLVLLGLDAKMAQYRDGAVFVRHVVDKVGMEEFNAVWTGPETLPSKAEITDPDAWVARVL